MVDKDKNRFFLPFAGGLAGGKNFLEWAAAFLQAGIESAYRFNPSARTRSGRARPGKQKLRMTGSGANVLASSTASSP
jgi:hypothetical protein